MSGDRIGAVETSRGDIRARQIVLAGGAWSSGIVKDLKIRMPMQPAKGYSVTFTRTDVCPGIPVGLSESKTVMTPLGESFRVAGTLEFAGFDGTYPRRRILSVVRSMADYFPDIDPSAMAVEEIWQGFRPCSPDGLPYLGRVDAIDNLIVAAGHGMLGITQAPVSGRIVAQLAVGERPALDIAPLRPDRFRRGISSCSTATDR
jgi:D-amino-acid dehydrogenase